MLIHQCLFISKLPLKFFYAEYNQIHSVGAQNPCTHDNLSISIERFLHKKKKKLTG